MKCLKFYGYFFVLLFVLLFTTCPNVKASTFQLNDDISRAVINYYYQNADTIYNNYYWPNNINKTEQKNALNSINISQFTQNINNYIDNLPIDITKDNITFLYYYYGNGYCTFVILISKNNSNNSNLSQIKYYQSNSTGYPIFLSEKEDNDNNTHVYAISMNLFSNGGLGTPTNITLTSSNTSLQTVNSKYGYSYFEPNLLALTSGNLIYDTSGNNSNTILNVVDYQFENIEPDNITSTYGYMWSPAYSGETRVNLLYNGNSNIDCDYYIGNALSHTYNFYYYSGDTKISVNDYISIYTTQTASGEWYKHYITNSGKEHLPNNTHFLLDVYASLGNQTATVIEGFNAFYTVEEVIPTPTPIPTATPTPTPTPDIGTISGQINDINNNINNSTQAIVQQISGDTQKITESIEEVKDFLSGEIDNNKSGEIENALNVQIEITDPTEDFFSWFFNQIKDCFTVTGNQTLTFEILENEITINSDDYIIDIPILSTILGTGSGIFILYGILQDIRKEIEKIKEGKFEELGKEDISANML